MLLLWPTTPIEGEGAVQCVENSLIGCIHLQYYILQHALFFLFFCQVQSNCGFMTLLWPTTPKEGAVCRRVRITPTEYAAV